MYLNVLCSLLFFFFFQAEDGIRDLIVTGVQTCALPILSPIAQPPAPKAPGEIPVDKIKVPSGFKVELWASGINNARVMTWGDRGTLFVSSRVAGNGYAVTDKRRPGEGKTIAKALNLPNAG